MALIDDLQDNVKRIVRERWDDIRDARVVPTPDSLTFSNTGAKLEATILYADLHQSTGMVDSLCDLGLATKAAEYYKAFLSCAAKILRTWDGTVTAYDGDRVMGVFVGEAQCEKAVIAAFQINYAVKNIINMEFCSFDERSHMPVQHTVGIDSGQLLVAKAGVRDGSDLVWVGPAANYAAKLNSFDGLDIEYSTRITTQVRNRFLGSELGRQLNQDCFWDGPYTNFARRSHFRSSVAMPLD